MSLKDQLDKVRKYFVEDDEDFDDVPGKPEPARIAPAAPAPEVKPVASANNNKRPNLAKNPPKSQNIPNKPSGQSGYSSNLKQSKAANQSRQAIAQPSVTPIAPPANMQGMPGMQTIAIKEPHVYEDIMEAARIVRNGESVLVTFKFMEDLQARRSIDFMTGVVFTLDGDIQNVGGQIFLMTPANVTVDASKELSILSNNNFENFDRI